MRVLSPGGDRGLSILIFHRVLLQKDPLFPDEIDREEFDHQVGMLKSCFNVIPLIDAVRSIRSRSLPPRAACITFDDGYADNAEIALPVLQSHGVSATFFIATGFLDGGRMWNDTVIELVRNATGELIDATSIGMGLYSTKTVADKQKAIGQLIQHLKYLPFEVRANQIKHLQEIVNVSLRTDLMMTSSQVRQLHRAGMGIGGHTVNHPILAKLNASDARHEIEAGKSALEAVINDRVSLFAYPNGKPAVDYQLEHVEMVKSLGFEGAVSTAWGSCSLDSNCYQLPRFSPWDRTRTRFAVRMAKNLLSHAEAV